MSGLMVRHRFNVWVDLPAISGDGWNRYPDYSAEETGRAIRRALHASGFDEPTCIVEHGETTPVDPMTAR